MISICLRDLNVASAFAMRKAAAAAVVEAAGGGEAAPSAAAVEAVEAVGPIRNFEF